MDQIEGQLTHPAQIPCHIPGSYQSTGETSQLILIA